MVKKKSRIMGYIYLLIGIILIFSFPYYYNNELTMSFVSIMEQSRFTLRMLLAAMVYAPIWGAVLFFFKGYPKLK